MRYKFKDKWRSPLVTVCLAFLLCSTPLKAQEAPSQEAAPTILDIPLGSSEVTLTFKGYWKGSGSLLGGLGISTDGSSPWALSWQSPGPPLLFAQELDLDVFLEVNRQWFLESCFSDNGTLEEYRMGYRGKENDTLEYVVLGNSGLEYPALPYSSLGGDTPSSIGGYVRLGNGPIKVHALARYDNSAQDEKTWIGTRESTWSMVSPLERERGRSFILPETNIASEVIVWIEDSENGSIQVTDGAGTGIARFRRARLGEYALSKEEGLLELAESPKGRVLVHWNGISAPSYTDGLLLEVREAFLDASEGVIDASTLPQPGAGQPVSIEGLQSLVLYEPGTFSPWEVQNLYRGPAGATEATLVDAASGEAKDSHRIRALSETRMPDSESALEDSTGLWIILANSANRNRRSVQERWPLLEEAPWLYLPSTRRDDSNLRLRFLSTGPESTFYIGTDAIAQTIRVFRNGLEDTLASFDESTGTVSLSSPVREQERVRITWAKSTEEAAYGSLALGLGLVKEETKTDPFGWGSSIFFRWSLLENAWASAGSQYPGSLGASAWVRYKSEQVLISASAALSHNQNDTSGLYRIDGFGDEAFTLWPASFETTRPGPSAWIADLDEELRRPLVYRDYSYVDFFGTSLGDFSLGAQVEAGKEGPYPVMDTTMGGPVLAAEFDLENDSQWTGWQIDIAELSDLFARAGTISLPLYFRNLSGDDNVLVTLQAGSLSQPEDWLVEQSALVWTHEVLNESVTGIPSSWRMYSIELDEEERAALASCRALRVVIQATGTTGVSGILVSGPLEIQGSLHSRWLLPAGASAHPLLADADANGYIASKPDPSCAIQWPERINRVSADEANRVLEWQIDSLESDEGTALVRRYAAPPLEDYEALSILVKTDSTGPQYGYFELVVANTVESALSITANTALKLILPLEAFTPGVWQLVRVSLLDSTVTLDGAVLPSASFQRNPTADSGESALVAICVRPADGESLPQGYTLRVDELSLEESRGWWAALGGLDYQQKISGPILQKGESVILKDYSGSAIIRGSLPLDADSTARLQSRGDFSLGILQANVLAGGAFSLDATSISRSLNHRIALPLGPLGFEDAFVYEPDENSTTSTRKISLTSPFKAAIEQKALRERDELSQDYHFTASVGTPYRVSVASQGKEQRTDNEVPMEEVPAPELSLHAGLEASAQWDSSESPLEPMDRSWPLALMDSYVDVIPVEGPRSSARVFDAKLGLSAGMPAIGVILNAEASSKQDRSLQNHIGQGSISLSVPWAVSAELFAITLGRSLKRQDSTAAQTALEDLNGTGMLFWEGANLLWSIPGFALFDPATGSRFSSLSTGSSEALWTDRIAFDWGPARRSGLKALFMPAKASIALERESGSELDTLNDTLYLSLSGTATAVNLFGDFGTHKITSAFSSDQYSQMLSFKIPVGGLAPLEAWTLDTRHSARFVRKGVASLTLSNTFGMNAEGFREAFSGSLTRATEKSPSRWLFVRIIPLLSRILNGTYLESLQKVSLKTEAVELATLNLEHTDSSSWQFTLSHEDRVSAEKHAVLSLAARLGLAQTEAAAAISLNAAATLSLTLRF